MLSSKLFESEAQRKSRKKIEKVQRNAEMRSKYGITDAIDNKNESKENGCCSCLPNLFGKLKSSPKPKIYSSQSKYRKL